MVNLRYVFSVVVLFFSLAAPAKTSPIHIGEFVAKDKKLASAATQVTEVLRAELTSQKFALAKKKGEKPKAKISGKLFKAGKEIFLVAKIELIEDKKVLGETITCKNLSEIGKCSKDLAKLVVKALSAKK